MNITKILHTPSYRDAQLRRRITLVMFVLPLIALGASVLLLLQMVWTIMV